jgi:hypothetical protein
LVAFNHQLINKLFMKAAISGRELPAMSTPLAKRKQPSTTESAERTLLPVKSGRYIGNRYMERWGVFSSAAVPEK